MKNFFLLAFVLMVSVAKAQPTDDVAAMRETASNFLKKADYDNAILVLNKALQTKPNDLEVSKDLLFAYYLKRDFANAIAFGKPLAERDDADVQTYQMLGLAYKSIAEDKEADKLYKKGLKKFPTEGILYSEYGDLLVAKQPIEAIKIWEEGISVDPNNFNNYYYLAKQYAENGNALWSILYAETFLNMESFTGRSTEMKNLLLGQYKAYFAAPLSKSANHKKNDRFAEAVEETFNKEKSQLGFGINPESLTLIRTRFILDWYNTHAKTYPFRLFEHQKQLLQEGMFEAYNFWLFGPATNLSTYQTWQQFHQEELNGFLGFIRSKVYKIPQGQQYKNL